jgi:hypothetical protein
MRPTPWHAASWERFINESLPELLASKLTITRYDRERKTGSVSITVGVIGAGGREITTTFDGIPRPDPSGAFVVGERSVVIVPKAEDERLTGIACCGEQALEFLEERLPEANRVYLVDEESLRAWLPLGESLEEFFLSVGQVLDEKNGVARATHLNRLLVPESAAMISPEQIGRACPIETPEGPRIGRVLTIATGAVIEGDVVKRSDESSDAFLGFAASLIPFIEHTDPARSLMGANMMRQWIPPLEPEAPLVRTGRESDESRTANGYNLLTAYLSVGEASCEDGLILSESAARRMRYDRPIEVGDKLSNRNGQKGVVSAIRPDGEMPALADGTPVDIVCSFVGLHTRMNSGQLFEAVAGRIAGARGGTYVVEPFTGNHRKRLSRELSDAGLPPHGMERLTLRGATLPYTTLAGWVYWGLTVHRSREKLRIFTSPGEGQRIGAMEYWILRDAGCYRTILECTGPRSRTNPDASQIADRIASGESLRGRSMPLERFTAAMKQAGIEVSFAGGKLAFAWCDAGRCILAQPVPHPWLREHPIRALECDAPEVLGANDRLRTLMESDGPHSLISAAYDRLSTAVDRYVESVFSDPSPWNDCLATDGVVFSGRGVIVPGAGVPIDRIAIPDEMAWEFYGPRVARRVGLEAASARSDQATAFLDEIMESSWVMINRAPSFDETTIIGFRPMRSPHMAIGINPLVCRWLNADFDGDQIAIYPMFGDEASEDVRRFLSVAGHLRRDPSRIEALVPPHEALFGLARAWMTRDGRSEISEILGEAPSSAEQFLRQDELMSAVRRCLERDGVDEALARLERLTDLGFREAVCGASLDPFTLCPADPAANESAMIEAFESSNDFSDHGLGPQLLLAKAGVRGKITNLMQLTCRRDDATATGLLDGLSPDELANLALRVRIHMSGYVTEYHGQGANHRNERLSPASTVMARALRSERPGVVFAAAAERGEVDPLTDRDARLFAGLLPEGPPTDTSGE